MPSYLKTILILFLAMSLVATYIGRGRQSRKETERADALMNEVHSLTGQLAELQDKQIKYCSAYQLYPDGFSVINTFYPEDWKMIEWYNPENRPVDYVQCFK